MAKQRDPVLDSMRGIGIVLMVLGHAGFPGSSFIYSRIRPTTGRSARGPQPSHSRRPWGLGV